MIWLPWDELNAALDTDPVYGDNINTELRLEAERKQNSRWADDIFNTGPGMREDWSDQRLYKPYTEYGGRHLDR